MGKMRAEVKILKDLISKGAKWAIIHDKDFHGSRATRVMIMVDDNCYVGIATVSKKDNFNRKLGRTIALGRAYKKYKLGDMCIAIPSILFDNLEPCKLN